MHYISIISNATPRPRVASCSAPVSRRGRPAARMQRVGRCPGTSGRVQPSYLAKMGRFRRPTKGSPGRSVALVLPRREYSTQLIDPSAFCPVCKPSKQTVRSHTSYAPNAGIFWLKVNCSLRFLWRTVGAAMVSRTQLRICTNVYHIEQLRSTAQCIVPLSNRS